jgi:hypothetical protein
MKRHKNLSALPWASMNVVSNIAHSSSSGFSITGTVQHTEVGRGAMNKFVPYQVTNFDDEVNIFTSKQCFYQQEDKINAQRTGYLTVLNTEGSKGVSAP